MLSVGLMHPSRKLYARAVQRGLNAVRLHGVLRNAQVGFTTAGNVSKPTVQFIMTCSDFIRSTDLSDPPVDQGCSSYAGQHYVVRFFGDEEFARGLASLMVDGTIAMVAGRLHHAMNDRKADYFHRHATILVEMPRLQSTAHQLELLHVPSKNLGIAQETLRSLIYRDCTTGAKPSPQCSRSAVE